MLNRLFPFSKPFGFSFSEDGGGDGSGNPDGAGNFPVDLNDEAAVADYVEKRGGLKNVLAELNRKSGEVKDYKTLREQQATLQAQLDALKNPPKPADGTPAPKSVRQYHNVPHVAEFVEKYKNGVPADKVQEYLEDLSDAMIRTSVEASKFWAESKTKGVDKYLKRAQETELREAISSLGKEKQYKFFIEKYKTEIEDAVKKQYPVDAWDDKAAIQGVLGVIIANHAADLAQSENVIPAIPFTDDTPRTSKAPQGAGVTERELDEAARVGNFDLADPEERKAAIKFAQSRKLRDEARNQK